MLPAISTQSSANNISEHAECVRAAGQPFRVCIKFDGTDIMGGRKCERVVLCVMTQLTDGSYECLQSPDDCLCVAAWDINTEDWHYLQQVRCVVVKQHKSRHHRTCACARRARTRAHKPQYYFTCVRAARLPHNSGIRALGAGDCQAAPSGDGAGGQDYRGTKRLGAVPSNAHQGNMFCNKAFIPLCARAQTPNGPVQIEFHCAADMKSLWIALGVSLSTKELRRCFCCEEAVQGPFKNLASWVWRKATKNFWGLPLDRYHFCALHMEMRIPEKLDFLLRKYMATKNGVHT